MPSVALPRLHPADSTPVTYELTKESLYEAGCLPPCLCPVLERKPFHGTFTLAPIGSNDLFQTFAVAEIDWMLPGNGTEVHVTGGGTYAVGGEAAPQHQLVLDLVVDGGPARRFDSGLVAGGQIFPAIEIPVAQPSAPKHTSPRAGQTRQGEVRTLLMVGVRDVECYCGVS